MDSKAPPASSSGKKSSRTAVPANGSTSTTDDPATAAADARNETERLSTEEIYAQTAKREYNRVCAAKSRANRKKKMDELEQQVEEANVSYKSLTKKNKGLREEVDLLLRLAICQAETPAGGGAGGGGVASLAMSLPPQQSQQQQAAILAAILGGAPAASLSALQASLPGNFGQPDNNNSSKQA